MNGHLVPCPACARLIRSREPRCPFCAGAIPAAFAAYEAPLAPPRGLSRFALEEFLTRSASAARGFVLLGSTLLAAGCGSRSELLESTLGDGPDACASQPAGGAGGSTGADYGLAPSPECNDETAVPTTIERCPGCEELGTAYLLCSYGAYSRCACAVPAGYAVCR